MKYYVKVDDQLFEVEISDLRSRPVLAIVDGIPFEVWPESSEQAIDKLQTNPAMDSTTASQPVLKGATLPASNATSPAVRAPLPGVIVSIAVKPGDEVKVGQELCVIEAMKMRNTIRASRNGQIVTIHASAGQTVNHSDLLMEYAE